MIAAQSAKGGSGLKHQSFPKYSQDRVWSRTLLCLPVWLHATKANGEAVSGRRTVLLQDPCLLCAEESFVAEMRLTGQPIR